MLTFLRLIIGVEVLFFFVLGRRVIVFVVWIIGSSLYRSVCVCFVDDSVSWIDSHVTTDQMLN